MPTQKSFTGQYLDGTGLLFYHARYYDPGLGRFVSADSIVPGNASGGMDGIAYKPLTVDLHEPGFVAAVNRENQFGPWYTLSDEERQELGSPWGPQNPQALNRYTYVQNNPLKWTDPGGHVPPPCVYCNAPWFNIRDWHPMAQGVVVVGCFIVGCTIDKAGTVIGPGAKSMVTSIGIMGVSSKVLQTGGNTIRGSTANALNKAHGLRLQPREWGRALEELKKDFLLANDHHGKILESGNYIDAKTGEVLGNILDYLP